MLAQRSFSRAELLFYKRARDEFCLLLHFCHFLLHLGKLRSQGAVMVAKLSRLHRSASTRSSKVRHLGLDRIDRLFQYLDLLLQGVISLVKSFILLWQLTQASLSMVSLLHQSLHFASK